MVTDHLSSVLTIATERHLIPDHLIRRGIRHICLQRLKDINENGCPDAQVQNFSKEASKQRIASDTQAANDQHYEVPARFYDLVLGQRKKYSCCLFDDATDLADAEIKALRVTCQRAKIRDGMRVLDLRCGWGSLTLWLLESYPHLQVTAVSNSKSQKSYILRQAAKIRASHRLEVITADVNELSFDVTFDRIVFVEMLEHVRNHRALFEKVSQWLEPDGAFFAHVFCHKSYAYEFSNDGATDWMARHFFSGGMMPSESLFHHYNDHLRVIDRWNWSGAHYERTSNQWLKNLDENRDEALAVLAQEYGDNIAKVLLQRWRIFFMACAEMFGHNAGDEWYISHYLFERAKPVTTAGSDLAEVPLESPAPALIAANDRPAEPAYGVSS